MSTESNPKLAAKSVDILMNPSEHKSQASSVGWDTELPAQTGRYPSCAICLQELDGLEFRSSKHSVAHQCKFLLESHAKCIMAHIITEAKRLCEYALSHPEEKKANLEISNNIGKQSTCPLCRSPFPLRFRNPMGSVENYGVTLLEIPSLYIMPALRFFLTSRTLICDMPQFANHLIVVFTHIVDAIRKFPCNRDELTATCIFLRNNVFPPLRFCISSVVDPPCKRIGLRWHTLAIRCDTFEFIHIWFRPLQEFDLKQHPFAVCHRFLYSVLHYK